MEMMPKHERVRVARVTIEDQRRTQQIADCWISISAARDVIGIWLRPDQETPPLHVPLANVLIDWAPIDAVM